MKKIVLATTSPEVSRREKRNNNLARTIAREGIVLLKNDGMLPLKNKKIALYGSGARQTVSGGTGSGAMHPRKCVGIEEGLLNSRFNVLTKDWLDRYDDFYNESYRIWKERIESKVVGVTDLFKILGVISQDRFVYPTGIAIEDKDITDQTENAVYVIARQAGEGADRKDIKADYRLDDIEYENLKKISAAYKNVCVVINVGGFIDLSFIEELNINAVIYYAQAGQAGGDAFADIIAGKVSPSGKLTATWAKELIDLPFVSEYSHMGNPKIQNYKEGIYVGYRYFDTFGKKPLFAFGYGLSYTDFKFSEYVTQLIGDKILISCRVDNVGNFAGKEVVQVYVSIPKADAEAKRLVAFEKTDVIGIGGHQHIDVSFTLRDLCWYDEDKAAYMLSAGKYVIRIGNSSDQTQAIAVLTCDKDIIMEQCENVCERTEFFEELSAPAKVQENISNLPNYFINTQTIRKKVNIYQRPCKKDDKIRAILTRLSDEDLAALVIGGGASAADEERLVNAMGASGTSTSRLYESYGIPNVIFSDGPAGLNVTPRVVELESGELKSADTYPQYDFGLFGKIMRSRMIAKPEDGICHYQYATAFPCGVLRAQTWNIKLMEEFGDAVGAEMEELGVTCWLAPGINITRNTLCGRTFEYCSEDPVLSGNIAVATVKGVQKHKGKGVSVKHFACNNSEFEREYSSSNISERALREIYLKGFEIVVKNANPMTIMAGYNKINGIYNTNNYDLLIKVLRNEWGFTNAVISDWDSVYENRGDILKAHASGCDLVMPGSRKQVEELLNGIKTGLINKEDVLCSAELIMQIILKNTVLKVQKSNQN